jgi:hypothetical protein
MVIGILVYCLLLFWILGIYPPPQKPKPKKTPEQELGEALTKYLSQLKKSSDK